MGSGLGSSLGSPDRPRTGASMALVDRRAVAGLDRSRGLLRIAGPLRAWIAAEVFLSTLRSMRAWIAAEWFLLFGSLHPHVRAWIMRGNQADRAISTSKLNALPRLHTWPIDVVVFHGSRGSSGFEGGFPLRCLQRLSRPHIATLHCGWRHNSSTRGASIPVLSY
jgi:hypothetical protein